MSCLSDRDAGIAGRVRTGTVWSDRLKRVVGGERIVATAEAAGAASTPRS